MSQTYYPAQMLVRHRRDNYQDTVLDAVLISAILALCLAILAITVYACIRRRRVSQQWQPYHPWDVVSLSAGEPGKGEGVTVLGMYTSEDLDPRSFRKITPSEFTALTGIEKVDHPDHDIFVLPQPVGPPVQAIPIWLPVYAQPPVENGIGQGSSTV